MSWLTMAVRVEELKVYLPNADDSDYTTFRCLLTTWRIFGIRVWTQRSRYVDDTGKIHFGDLAGSVFREAAKDRETLKRNVERIRALGKD